MKKLATKNTGREGKLGTKKQKKQLKSLGGNIGGIRLGGKGFLPGAGDNSARIRPWKTAALVPAGGTPTPPMTAIA